ncbi:MAG: YfhO family protein [Thermomicrobiales bacterium]|nr:YfhO family protein [Thermomicrobiales bacterium]
MLFESGRAEVNPGTIPARESTGAIPTGRFWESDRAGALGVLAITLIASLVLFSGGTVIGQDSATQFYPWYTYLGERLSDLSLPGWNPYQFAGAPFAGDPQSGWMYFPAMVIFTVFSIALAAPLFVVFHLALAGAGTYVLSRLLGIGAGGALVAAAAYELTSPVFARSVCCPAQIEVGAWMPMALVGAEIAFRNRHWAWRMIGWTIGGLALSQALGAWLGQGSYYYLLILAAYIAYRSLTRHTVPWRDRFICAVTTGLPIGLIGAGIAAAGILPRFLYVERSSVAGGEYDGASSWASTIGGVTPGMAWDHMLDATLYYPGAAALALTMAGVVLARRRFASTFFACLGGAAMLLAMPWNTPLHWLMFTLLPKFEELHNHWPERVAIVSYLAIAMLAGMAVESLRRDNITRRRFVIAFGIPIGGMLILAMANAPIPFVTLLAITATLILVWLKYQPNAPVTRPWLPYLMAAVIAIDLIASFTTVQAKAPYGGFHRVDVGSFFAPTGASEFLEERMKTEPGRYIGFDPAKRVFADGYEVLYRYQFADPETVSILVNNRGVLYGIEDVQGYNPVQPRRFVEYLIALNGAEQEYHDANISAAGLESPLFDLLNVRYIVIPARYDADRADLAELEATFPVIYRDLDAIVLENPNAFPRAWLTHEVRQESAEEALRLLAAGEVDPAVTTLVEGEPPVLGSLPANAEDAIVFTERSPDRIEVTVTTAADGLLVLSEPYDRGWNAYVDGEEVEILRANHLFRAVPVPAGKSVVEFRYEPIETRIGLAISGLTLLIVIPVFVLAIRRRGKFGEPKV